MDLLIHSCANCLHCTKNPVYYCLHYTKFLTIVLFNMPYSGLLFSLVYQCPILLAYFLHYTKFVSVYITCTTTKACKKKFLFIVHCVFLSIPLSTAHTNSSLLVVSAFLHSLVSYIASEKIRPELTTILTAMIKKTFISFLRSSVMLCLSSSLCTI